MIKNTKVRICHIVCLFITFGFVCCSVFLFSSALGRIVEGVRDFGLSIGFYFCELLQINHNITPTVCNLPQMPFFPNYGGDTSLPVISLAKDWEQFKLDFSSYWLLWVNSDNFLNYVLFLGRFLYKVCVIVLLLTPCIIVFIALFRRSLKSKNNNYDVDSRPLKIAKKLFRYILLPLKNCLLSFFDFLTKHKTYHYLGLYLAIQF